MKIVNRKLLAEFRLPGCCEWCRKPCLLREPVHIRSRGSGGGDWRTNLACLGSTRSFACPCHTNSHNGHEPFTRDLLILVAKREGVERFGDIIEATNFIIRLPKGSSAERIEEAMKELEPSVAALVRRELREAKAIP